MGKVNKINAGSIMGTKETPCKRDCPNRCAVPNCHGTCEKYLTWKKQLEEVRKKEILNNIFVSYECERSKEISKLMRRR